MQLNPARLALACAFFVSVPAMAQESADGPLPTAGSKAGGAPTDAGPGEIAQTPAPAMLKPQAPDAGLMRAGEEGRKAPLLGEYHGSVGAVVGTGGLRGAYGHINARPSDNVTLDLRFSTIRGGDPYRGIYGYGPGLYADPLAGPPYRPRPEGWTSEMLGPDDTPPPAAPGPGR